VSKATAKKGRRLGFIYIISVFNCESTIALSHTVRIILYLYLNTSFPHKKTTVNNTGKPNRKPYHPHGFRNPHKTINQLRKLKFFHE
jgi:hypothetical protein